jgi:hypothetical protein
VAPGVLWLTHKGREVLPSGLKTDAGASGKKRGGGGAWVRWLTHTGREVSPSGLKTDAGFGGAIASRIVAELHRRLGPVSRRPGSSAN